MPKEPTDTPTGVDYRPETEEDREVVAAALAKAGDTCQRCGSVGGRLYRAIAFICQACRDDPAASRPTRAISAERWAAWREFLNSHGNAFLVGAAGGGRGVVIINVDFLARPLMRAEVANLIAWLVMVSDMTAGELEDVFQGQGFSLRTLLATEPAPPFAAPHVEISVEEYAETARRMLARILESFRAHPVEAASITSPWQLYQLPGFKCDDIRPTLVQAEAALLEARRILDLGVWLEVPT